MCSQTVANGRSLVKLIEQRFALRGALCYDGPQVPEYAPGDDTKLTDQLTERQSKILDYIRYVTRVRSYPPSVREIGEAVGLSSSSTVHNHLNQLERRG